ncbi:MAG: hypothetical protein ACREXI_10880 [Caldimonas sp.]
MNPPILHLPATLLFLVACGLALPGHAADKPRQSSFGAAKPGGPLLSRTQLRDCLARQDRLRGRPEEMARRQAALDVDRAEIERVGGALKEQAAALDRTSAEAVAAYNAQVQARDKLIDDYQGAVPAFNTEVEALKGEQAAFASACQNRRYDETDELAIRKGK